MESNVEGSDTSEVYVAWVSQQLQQFSESAPEGQTVDALIPLEDGSLFTATAFAFQNPDLIKVNGTDANGNEVVLLTHKSRFQVVLRKTQPRPEVKPEAAFQEQEASRQILFDESA